MKHFLEMCLTSMGVQCTFVPNKTVTCATYIVTLKFLISKKKGKKGKKDKLSAIFCFIVSKKLFGDHIYEVRLSDGSTRKSSVMAACIYDNNQLYHVVHGYKNTFIIILESKIGTLNCLEYQ